MNRTTKDKTTRYRWFKIWIGLGAALAVLLLVNSVVNYVLVSRRLVIEQLRRDLSKYAREMERQIRQMPAGDRAQLASIADDINGDRKFAWIDLRSREGNVLVHRGIEIAPSFSDQELRGRLRDRQPVFTVRNTPSGKVVVEAFPVRLRSEANAAGPGFAVLEIAIPLDAANAAFWPLRRNLMLNCSAALAMLVSLVFMALRFRSYCDAKQLEKQVQIAREVQRDLLPSPRREGREVELTAECIPAGHVGGDFYDQFPVNGDGLALVLGDVSGKGIPAALLMGVLHGAVRSSSWTESPWYHEECSRHLNQLLCERVSGERYASMFWAYFEPQSRTLHYVNAGHCPPLLIRKNADQVEIVRLEKGGPVLGLLPNARYEQGTIEVRSDDLMVLYSDGVVEAENSAGEEFGEQRLFALLEASAAKNSEQVHHEVMQAVRKFAGTTNLQDDLTLLVARFQNLANTNRNNRRVTPDMETLARTA
jgi:hypothetical protein